MASASLKSKKRVIVAFVIFCILLLVVCIKVGYIQIVQSQTLTKKAIAQQTEDEVIEAKRGDITDRNGKKLASSTIRYTVWARPGDIKDVDSASKKLAKILDMDEAEVKKLLSQDKSLVKVAKYLEYSTAQKVKNSGVAGISITEQSKRYYMLGNFASQLLGSVTDDNNGLTGLEEEYNNYLKGISGRWVQDTDASGNPLSYGSETYHKAQDGDTLVLTLDEVIQHYAEDAIRSVYKKTEAKRVMCLVMDPETGDVLAAASTPSFNPNDPRVPAGSAELKAFNKLSSSKQMDYLNEMWRCPLFNDLYEPGSTAKLMTTAIALEENLTSMSEKFYCKGYIYVAGVKLKCWSWRNPHGEENLEEAVGNSCNPVFVTLGERIGLDKFYKYMELFGITQKTNIDYPGEASPILQDKDTAGPVGLATMAYGQGIAVTPVQLLSAVCALGNDGKLMQPKLVKEIKSADGKVVKKSADTEVRQVVSKATAKKMCTIMEYVVDKGGGEEAQVAGYRVGGKTGTANKVVNGKYSDSVCASFVGLAPMDDPKVAVLFIVDSPKGEIYGSTVAAPGAKKVLKKTLRYMGIKADYTSSEKKKINAEKTIVPDVTGDKRSEAIKKLKSCSLKYKISPATDSTKDFKVTDQYPKAGDEIESGGTVYLYRE